jgi:hypothetical protein
MNHKAIRRTQPGAGIENMNSVFAGHVEAVQLRGRVQTRDGMPSGQPVERTELRHQVRLTEAIDTPPYPGEPALADRDVQLLAGHHREKLGGGCKFKPLKKSQPGGIHACSVRPRRSARTPPLCITTCTIHGQTQTRTK